LVFVSTGVGLFFIFEAFPVSDFVCVITYFGFSRPDFGAKSQYELESLSS